MEKFEIGVLCFLLGFFFEPIVADCLDSHLWRKQRRKEEARRFREDLEAEETRRRRYEAGTMLAVNSFQQINHKYERKGERQCNI